MRKDVSSRFVSKEFEKTLPENSVIHLIFNILETKPKWKDKEYRQEYMATAVEQTLSWQIKINREHRNLNQEQLANLAEISLKELQENEDTTFEDHDLKTLVKIANAFDCALLVKFVPYSELALESHRLGERDLYACSYEQETSKPTEVVYDPTSLALR